MSSEVLFERSEVLIIDDGQLTANWPFLLPRLEGQLGRHDLCVRSVSTGGSSPRLRDIEGIDTVVALVVIDVEPEAEDIDAMRRLEVVAGIRDGAPLTVADVLAERDIPFVDGARGRGQSRAEMAVGLILAALRQIPGWHSAMLNGPKGWPLPQWQYTDHPAYVNGTLRGKDVVLIGLDTVSQEIAELCAAFGARVAVVDPTADEVWLKETGAHRIDLDEVWSAADILVSANGRDTPRLSADMVDMLPLGALVVTVSPHGIDLPALRKRVLAGHLAWATDVYDTAPVAAGDPLLGLENVVHTPGIAARTRDAMLTIADVLADNIIRVMSGADPLRWDCVAPQLTNTPSAESIDITEGARSR